MTGENTVAEPNSFPCQRKPKEVSAVQSLPAQTNNPEPQQQLSGSAPVDQDGPFSADLSSSAMSSELGVDVSNLYIDSLLNVVN